MGFSAPWLLAGLAAISLPIWLHLLKRHKTPPQPFSSLMFFEQREQSSVKHRRLDYLLLLALRSLMLALLAFAFAGPYLLGGGSLVSTERNLTVVAVDNSFSMRQGGRLDRAKNEAAALLGRLGPDKRGQVLSFAGQVQLMGEPSADPSTLRAAVQAIRQEDTRGTYGDLARALRSIAQSAQTGLDIHVFSDFQKTSLPAGFVEMSLPPGAKLSLHPLADRRLPNWSVESVISPRRLEQNQKGRVQATIAGYGTDEATLKVSLLLRGANLETKTVTVPAGGRASAEFFSLQAPHGWSRAEVRIEGRDPFPDDDRFYFAVEHSDPMPVLFVHEQRDMRSQNYFRAALEAASQSAFSLQAVTPVQLGGINPSRYAFVVLSNVLSVPPEFEQALKEYVNKGGSVLIAMGAASAARARLPVFEGAVTESRYAGREGERFQAVDWLDQAHPSIRKANRWEGVKFYQVFGVEAPGARVLARVTDQTPVLLEKSQGAGKLLLFASTFDNIANDFPLHSSFVPFVEQTARYLAGLEESSGVLPVGAYYELRKAAGSGASVEVLDPDGRRMFDLSEATRALGVTMSREGFYEVRRASGRSELVAVNADRRESDFELIPKETLALWQNTGEASTAAAETAGAAPKPLQIGWHLLGLVFLLAVAESIVSGRYLSMKKKEAA